MEKMEKIKNILNQNYINYKDIKEEDMKTLADDNAIFFFDTENTPIIPEEIVNKFNLKNIEYNTLEEFNIEKEGNILTTLMRNKDLKTEIYIWMVGTNLSNKVFWGNSLTEFIKFMQSIDIYKVNNKKNPKKYTIYVHNLSWDLEFFKYWLKNNHYNQAIINPNSKNKSHLKEEKTFLITENQGQVFNATIQAEEIKIKRKKFKTNINLIDSLKITPLSLEKISEELINIDPIFIKDTDSYKYNLIRDPKNYTPETLEAFYQYKDIYILKEWYNQFIIPNYINEGVNVNTISAMAFDSILNKSFYKYKQNGVYDHLKNKKGEIKDRDIYNQHFALNEINKYPQIVEYIRHSYKGGITTASLKHKKKAKSNKEEIKGVSIDISSSYPSQIVKRPLPYGVPTGIKEGKYKDFKTIGNLYNYHIITIGFDGWSSKNPNNTFGLPIKIKGLNNEQKKEMNWTTNEYYTTNIVNFEPVGRNRIEIQDPKRAEKINKLPFNYILTIPAFEYETWIKMFNFFHQVEGKTIKGVYFIDYISFKSEVGYMKEGIEYYYKQKEEGTKSKNKAKTYNAKIIINSFYGKNCSKRERSQRLYNLDSDIIKLDSLNETNKNEWLDNNLYAVQYGSAITSWGRIQLMETIIALGCDKFIYADTDSIKIEGINKEELIKICNEKGILLSTTKESKTLGGWDYEYTFNDFKPLAQKKYIYKKEGSDSFNCKCSGLPEEIRNDIKTKEDFYIGATFTRLSKTKVNGGYLLLPTKFTIKDSTIY